MAARFERGDRRARARGMALVMVLVFAVGAFMLAVTMLTLSNAGARVEGSRHRDKSLHSVARYGLATAINEVNRNRDGSPGPYDPTGNGEGYILAHPDGQRGWPVRDRSGKLLGRFTTMFARKDLSNGQRRRTIEVVAVEGEFPVDAADVDARLAAGTLRFTTAELEVATTGVAFDRNALSIRGNAGAGGRNGFYASPAANQVKIFGNEVPAVNISDATMFTRFTDATAISKWGELTGLDPVTKSAATTRPKTVTNEESGLLNQETMAEIATGINARVAQVIASGAAITSGNQTVVRGDYYVDDTLVVGSGQTLSGKGTLVINQGLEIRGTLDWEGEIIIANNDAASVNVKGSLDVDGILSIQGYGTANNMNVTVGSGGKVNVGKPDSNPSDTVYDGKPGAFTILGDSTTSNPLRFNSGASGASVEGIFTIMGNALSMTFDTGSKVDVNGSLALISPSDAAVGLDIKFRNAAHCTLNYVEKSFDGSVKRLGDFFAVDGAPVPIQVTAYLEDQNARVTLLKKHVAADATLTYSVDE